MMPITENKYANEQQKQFIRLSDSSFSLLDQKKKQVSLKRGQGTKKRLRTTSYAAHLRCTRRPQRQEKIDVRAREMADAEQEARALLRYAPGSAGFFATTHPGLFSCHCGRNDDMKGQTGETADASPPFPLTMVASF